MHSLYRGIDRFTEHTGRLIAWLTLAMVLVQFIVVLQRYVFGIGSIKMQESIIYMHGMLFMLAGAYTLLHDGHVRVDIIYGTASEKKKAWTDLLGTVFFLIPMCILILWSAWPDVALSWKFKEGSTEASGIPYKYLLKTCLLIFPALLLLQAISIITKSILRIAGERVDDRYADLAGGKE